MAKIIELILTEERKGSGKEGDPMRLVTQFFNKQGQIIMEHDPYTKETLVCVNAIDKN